MKITGNESVNPIVFEQDNGYGVRMMHFESSGITLRQHFAAKAMQGCIASSSGLIQWPNKDEIAAKAVEYADALIKKLNETKNPNI